MLRSETVKGFDCGPFPNSLLAYAVAVMLFEWLMHGKEDMLSMILHTEPTHDLVDAVMGTQTSPVIESVKVIVKLVTLLLAKSC